MSKIKYMIQLIKTTLNKKHQNHFETTNQAKRKHKRLLEQAKWK